MNSPQVSSSASDAGDEETMQLATVIARALLGPTTRKQGRFCIDQFVRAVEAEMGGTLVVKAPSAGERRGVTEIRYASEGFAFGAGFNVQ